MTDGERSESTTGKSESKWISDDSPRARWGCAGVLALWVVLIAGGVSVCNHEASESARIEAEKQAREAKREKAKYDRRVASGAVCQDGPKGAVTAFEMNIRQRLKDPDSYEHLGTVIKPTEMTGSYEALARFRSRNSFGAMVIGTAVARLYLSGTETCEVRSIEVDG